jgi:hypothetical protein
MTLIGGFLQGKAIEEGTNEGRLLRQIHELADGHLTGTVSGLRCQRTRRRLPNPMPRCKGRSSG